MCVNPPPEGPTLGPLLISQLTCLEVSLGGEGERVRLGPSTLAFLPSCRSFQPTYYDPFPSGMVEDPEARRWPHGDLSHELYQKILPYRASTNRARERIYLKEEKRVTPPPEGPNLGPF